MCLLKIPPFYPRKNLYFYSSLAFKKTLQHQSKQIKFHLLFSLCALLLKIQFKSQQGALPCLVSPITALSQESTPIHDLLFNSTIFHPREFHHVEEELKYKHGVK